MIVSDPLLQTPFVKLLNTLTLYGFKQPLNYPITTPNLATRNRGFTTQDVTSILKVPNTSILCTYCQDNNIPVTNTDLVQLADELSIFHHCLLDRLYEDRLITESMSPATYLDALSIWLGYSGRIPFYFGWVDALFIMIGAKIEEICPNDPKVAPLIGAIKTFITRSSEKRQVIYDGLFYISNNYPVHMVADYVDLVHTLLSSDSLSGEIL